MRQGSEEGKRKRKILVIDDDPETSRLLRSWFDENEISIQAALNGLDGIRAAQEQEPDIILLDLRMPGMDGLAVAEQLKADPRTTIIPVILLTACRSVEQKVQAFSVGADDYVTKPFDFGEIGARIESLIKRRDVYCRMHSTIDDLKLENVELERMLTLDEKTGLFNFREFRRKLREEWMRSERYGAPISLVIFDLDNFKKVNDTYGHRAGDIALQEFSTLLAGGARSTDMVARYGGEEFAMILPHTDTQMAIRVADRIRAAAEQFVFMTDEHPARITVSGGVATYPTSRLVDSVDTLVEYADRALYMAKGTTKNVVYSTEDLRKAGELEDAHKSSWSSRTSSSLLRPSPARPKGSKPPSVGR